MAKARAMSEKDSCRLDSEKNLAPLHLPGYRAWNPDTQVSGIIYQSWDTWIWAHSMLPQDGLKRQDPDMLQFGS